MGPSSSKIVPATARSGIRRSSIPGELGANRSQSRLPRMAFASLVSLLASPLSYCTTSSQKDRWATNSPEIHFFESSIVLLSTMTSSKVSLSMKKKLPDCQARDAESSFSRWVSLSRSELHVAWFPNGANLASLCIQGAHSRDGFSMKRNAARSSLRPTLFFV